MCKCDPRILNTYCGNGLCQHPDDIKRMEAKNQQIRTIAAKNYAKAYGNILCVPDYPPEDQWFSAFGMFKEVGLSVVPTEHLKELEDFKAKVEALVNG